MKKDQETIPTCERWERKNKEVFFIPEKEQKDFYLKLAFVMDPHACAVERTEYELLKILHRNLKKALKFLTLVNGQQWDERVSDIQTCYGHYLMQESIDKKERKQIYHRMGHYLQFLTQMAMNSRVISQLTDIYIRYYADVEQLLEEYPQEKNALEKNKDS